MKNDKAKIILICLTVLIIALIGFEWYKINIIGTGTSEDNIEIKGYDSSAKAVFYTYKNELFCCTEDSMQRLNENGEVVWTDTYNMNKPYIIGCRNIVGISEEDGRNVRVYNENGRMYETENGTVMSFGINSEGETAVIYKSENNYRVYVYESDGTKMFEINRAADDGIPMSAALSDDGNILALNCLLYDDIKISSNVMFYYLGSDAGSTSDIAENGNILAAFSMEGEFCGFVDFLNKNSLIAVTDKQIKCVRVSLEEGCKDKWNTELKNEIDAFEVTDEGNIAAVFGKQLINKAEPYDENSVIWYSSDGEILNKYVSEKEVDRLSSGFGSTIVGSGRSFKSIKNDGGIEWEYDALQDVQDIKYFKDTNRVLLVTSKGAAIINPKNKYVNEEMITEAETDEKGTAAEGVSEIKEKTDKNDEEESKAEKESTNQEAAENQTEAAVIGQPEITTEEYQEIISENETPQEGQNTEQDTAVQEEPQENLTQQTDDVTEGIDDIIADGPMMREE